MRKWQTPVACFCKVAPGHRAAATNELKGGSFKEQVGKQPVTQITIVESEPEKQAGHFLL